MHLVRFLNLSNLDEKRCSRWYINLHSEKENAPLKCIINEIKLNYLISNLFSGREQHKNSQLRNVKESFVIVQHTYQDSYRNKWEICVCHLFVLFLQMVYHIRPIIRSLRIGFIQLPISYPEVLRKKIHPVRVEEEIPRIWLDFSEHQKSQPKWSIVPELGLMCNQTDSNFGWLRLKTVQQFDDKFFKI